MPRGCPWRGPRRAPKLGVSPLDHPVSPQPAEARILDGMAKTRRTKPAGPPARPVAKRGPTDVAPAGYAELLAAIKQRVQTAQVRAAVAVNRELILLYWQIGRDVLRRQREEGWGRR